MMIAAALTGASPDAPIAPTYDGAACVMIADTGDLAHPRYVTADIPRAMYEAEVEVLLCGDIYDREEFERIARYCITRYRAAGMAVPDAVRAMDRYELELIRDYVGGTDCSSHGGGSCDCGVEE